MFSKLRAILGLNKKKEILEKDKAVVKSFRKRYAHFRKLLDANAALAELMADLEIKLQGNALFGSVYIKQSVSKALHLARRMANSLQAMNPSSHQRLNQSLETIEANINDIFKTKDIKETCPYLTISLRELTLADVDWVGGKCANLGAMQNIAKVPVPRGFAVSTAAYHCFMNHNDLKANIVDKIKHINLENRAEMISTLEQVREIIEQAALPDELIASINEAWGQSFGNETVTLAIRSSAQAEDGAKSFAGQFLSELQVSRSEIFNSYKRVLASLFTPSATLYRLHQGIDLESSAMAVAFLEMVPAVASGVAYSHDPVNLLNETIIINGVWGLGKYAVDGLVPPDVWIFTRTNPPVLIRRKAGNKQKMLTVTPQGLLLDTEVPLALHKEFSLSESEALQLATYVMQLDNAYASYQDVEWAKDSKGELVFLQSRPLGTKTGSSNAPKPPLLTKYPLLLQSQDLAFNGIGCGKVVQIHSPEDLANFPVGGILVAQHSKAEYAQVMDRAQAVIAENGGVTGHMATICREFRVPCILNATNALTLLQADMQITVDSFNGYVYEGIAEELLPLRLNLEAVRLQDTPMLALLREVASHLTPLNLIDPSAGDFTPAHCKTVHDVMRYVHELSYYEMFSISDSAVNAGGVSLKLLAPLPIDLHLIDLDNGTTASATARSVNPEEIICAPLKAMLQGMLRPDTMFRKPRPVNMGGFFSVMGNQIATPQGGERFGDKSYAIISDRYMNFSSRVGYHYSVLDSYCGETTSKNYISFSFQGGAAGQTRRIRRCRGIAMVLEELGFTVTMRGDMVKSRIQKYEKSVIIEKMDQLGRLLQVTRQLDMLMVDEASVIKFKEDFMNGIYN